jgi:hypothetical protein
MSRRPIFPALRAPFAAVNDQHLRRPSVNRRVGQRRCLPRALIRVDCRWRLFIALLHLAADVQHHAIWFVHLRALIESGRCEGATRWRTALEGYLPANRRDARALAAAAARPCIASP